MKKNYSAVEQLFVVLTEKWHYEKTSKSGSSLKKFNFLSTLTLFFLLIASLVKAQTTATFTTTSSWTCPAGVFNIKVEAYGAGGGGGGGKGTSDDGGGGGGGGGAYTVINSVTTVPGTNYIITIGNGGTAGVAGSTGKAGDGGNTTATFGATTITANGGIGGNNGAVGAGGAGGAGGTFAGGNGAAGTNGRSGGGGGGGGSTSSGTTATNATGGNGGGGSAGKGGNGSGSFDIIGQIGANYGAGGGAGTGTANGAAGAGGYFIITYTSATGCTNTSQYPSGSIAAPTTNSPVTISTAQYQSEYNVITGIVSGSTYILSNNLGGFVTIHSGTYNGTVAAAGNSPLTWTPTSSGTFYIHWNTNSSCGTASNTGTTTIQCSSCSGSGTAANNECSTASPLTVTGTCSYATYTTQGATQSTTTPLPTCASFAGGDVWFTAVVPANGQITIDTQAGGITDSGMALYTGTCGGLTLVSCDDDSSANGAMSSITATGLTAGSTVYIRVWEYGGDTSGTFGICVTSPLCGSAAPSGLTATPTSTTAATATWTASSPAPAAGYNYYITTSSTAPTSGTTPTGSVGAGVTTLNLTGLSANTTYYLWVRSNCGGTDGTSGWTSTTFTTPVCSSFGPGTGTSSLGCPSVVSGGLGLSGGSPAPITCLSPGSVTLEATYLALGETTNYSVSSIAYNPPYQFNCLRNNASTGVDDKWSPVVNLPFDFCFYGNNYNQCVIGTNGVITFDTTKASTSSGYAFSNNLPSTASGLFPNSIYGVYHDVDISKGGEIGWELITLNTGCRALVASWSDVPMFSNNSLLYTGMMVLYENTNVIEVYIKEKRVDGTWNSGNAIVGIQNSTGTAAVVAPNRNGLDTDWTVLPATGEAWRFTPSGTSITSIKWYEGLGVTGPVVGTTNNITVTPSSTTTYTAEVTYTLCDGRTVKETDDTTVTVTGSKTWNGSVSTDWNTANNWTPSGVPTSTDCVVVPTAPRNAIVSGNNYNGVGHNLTVQNGGNLSIASPTSPNRTSLTITDKITVNTGGVFTVNNSANLIQINNVSNTGNINMLRDAFIDYRDYVYWSSPVAGFNSANISTYSSNNNLYKWIPTVAGNGTGNFGNWVNGTETMVIGKGYIERGLNNAPLNSPVNFTSTFTGVPNNGTITTPIYRGTYNTAISYISPFSTTNAAQDDDNWNLLGNPYPSSLDAKAFLIANAANLDGFIKVWTHGIAPSTSALDPFYNNYGYNYDPTDYLTYNLSGAQTQNGFDGYIGAGQGFITKMLHTSASTSANAVFNNTMRSNTFRNDQFFKNSNTNPEGRIWLDLVSSTASNSTLVAYVDGATNSKDQMYDAQADLKATFSIYSLLDGYDRNIIQGRSLPFDQNDQVPLVVKLPTTGSYNIAIQGVDGLFSNQTQNIFLEDKQLNIIHDLRTAPYTFNGVQGENLDRFVLRYTNQTLGNNTFDYNNTVNIFADNSINVKSSLEKIKEVSVYDVLGKTLVTKKKVNNTEISITEVRPTTNVLIVKIKLENDTEIIKKIIY